MKKLFVLLMGLTIVFTLAACGPDERNDLAPGEQAITFWNIFTGPDGAEMRALVDDFNAEHEGEIRVSTQTIPANDFYEVLNTSVPQGQGPDVAIMHLDHIAVNAQLGMLNSIDHLIDENMGENYIEQAWNAGAFEGSRYAVPLDVHPIGLYYNKDILDEAGVEVPTTYYELIDACDALQDYVDHCMPLSSMWPSQTVFTAALFQHGGRDLDEDGLYPAFNDASGYAALDTLHSLIYEHGISPGSVNVDEDLTLFRQGRAAFHINGIWMLNAVHESGINFGTASIETLFGPEPAIWAGSHSFVLPYQTGLTEEKEEAIMTFIEYITANSLRWAEAGQIPADLTVLNSEAFQAMDYHNDFFDMDALRFVTVSPYFEDGFEPVYSRVTTAMSNSDADIQALLDDAEQEGIELVNEALGH